MREQRLDVFAPAAVFADGDELHFGRHGPAPCVVHLRDVGAGLGAAGQAFQVEAQLCKR
jgi:hypothetical protein